jgi:hypothetical protein
LEHRSFFSPFSEVIALLIKPTALLCLAMMVAAQLIGNVAIATMSGPFPPGGQQMAEAVRTLVPLAKFAVFMAAFFILARKFGSSDGTAGKANVLVWLFLMIVYFAVTSAAARLPGMLPDIGQMGTRRLPATLSAISYVVRLMFFPVMIYIAAAVHQSGSLGLPRVLVFIATRGIAWTFCFALFGLILAIALFAMPLGLSTASGVPPRGALFVIALVGIGGQLVNMLFAIGACRALRSEAG